MQFKHRLFNEETSKITILFHNKITILKIRSVNIKMFRHGVVPTIIEIIIILIITMRSKLTSHHSFRKLKFLTNLPNLLMRFPPFNSETKADYPSKNSALKTSRKRSVWHHVCKPILAIPVKGNPSLRMPFPKHIPPQANHYRILKSHHTISQYQ